MPDISPDTWAQIIANIGIGVVAVYGSIRGATYGAKVGAKATEEATTAAIASERETAHEQRLHEAKILSEQRTHEDRMLIRALVTECRLNAVFMRAERKYAPDPRFMVPLRHIALDHATAVLADLRSGDRELAEATIAEWLWFNQLVTIRERLINDMGDTVAPALIQEIQTVGLSLPASFDLMANMLADRFNTAGDD